MVGSDIKTQPGMHKELLSFVIFAQVPQQHKILKQSKD